MAASLDEADDALGLFACSYCGGPTILAIAQLPALRTSRAMWLNPVTVSVVITGPQWRARTARSVRRD